MIIKIAAVTEDKQTLTSHFGMAPFYRVFQIEDGQIKAEEERTKPYHGGEHAHGQPHGHDDMFAPISDCQVLLCGGMGEPAYEKARATGLDVILTGGEIKQAVQSYMNGQLSSDMRRIHHH